MSLPPPRSDAIRRRGWRLVAACEPILLLLLVPPLWLGGSRAGFLLLALPAFWLVRRRATGRFTVPTPVDAPCLGVLVLLPLSLWPVTNWDLALQKLSGVLFGLAMLSALANAVADRTRLLAAALLISTGLGGAITLAALLATGLPSTKVLALGPIRRLFPLMLHGFTPGRFGALNPNEAAGALITVLPLALALCLGLLRGRPSTPGLIAAAPGLAGVAMLLAVVLTQSRSGYLGGVVGGGVVLAWGATSGRGRRATGAVVGSGLAGAIALAALAWRTAPEWALAAGSGAATLAERLELWRRAVQMLLDFPLTGVGLGQYPTVLTSLYPTYIVPLGVYLPHAHDVLLQLALDFGIPGGVNAAGLLALSFLAAWRAYRRSADPLVRSVAVGVIAGLLAFLAYGMTDAIALGARGALGLWVLLGLAAALGRSASVDLATAEAAGSLGLAAPANTAPTSSTPKSPTSPAGSTATSGTPASSPTSPRVVASRFRARWIARARTPAT